MRTLVGEVFVSLLHLYIWFSMRYLPRYLVIFYSIFTINYRRPQIP